MLISRTAAEIAELVGGTLKGTYAGELTGVSSLKEAMTTDVAFLNNEKYASQLLPSKAGVVLVQQDNSVEPPEGRSWIYCKDPSHSFTKVAELFTPPPVQYPAGIGAGAWIDPTAVVPASVHVGVNAVICAGVVIGENTIISAGCYIGEKVQIGENCRIYPNVTIRERCLIGNRVVIHPGTSIGSDGFGFESGPAGHTRIPQVGIVQLDDDVEIGANSCIDRARFGRTWIQKGTKIDNLVQVAHNVQIGAHCLVVGQSGIAGSSILGNGVVMAGRSAISGHLKVGDGTILMACAGLTKDSNPGSVLFGFPAEDRKVAVRQLAYVKKLPDLVQELKELKSKLAALETKLSQQP